MTKSSGSSGALNLKFWPRSIPTWPYGIELKQPWKLPYATWVPILQECANLILILTFSLQCHLPERSQKNTWHLSPFWRYLASGRKLHSANRLKPPRCCRGPGLPGLPVHPFAHDHSRPTKCDQGKASRAFHGAGGIEGFKQHREIEHINAHNVYVQLYIYIYVYIYIYIYV